ncbi:membrane protein insertase YidC [Coralloluteibacterium thermophilus]|uniref:Membrane protein insertase YidC n=1 Tax=Coralloluteibacterium thermophilum TaxID=2707049 RepID=A0ABV9NRJ9_9GAMM
MNQTRVLLLFAWLFVAAMLWMNWNREMATPPAPAVVADVPGAPALDGAIPEARAPDALPAAPGSAAAVPDAAPSDAAQAAPVTLANDVLRLSIDGRGGTVLAAELLDYAQTTDEGSPPVRLLDTAPASYYVAQMGLVSSAGPAPNHESAFRLEPGSAREVDGRSEVAFVWEDGSGLRVRRVFALTPGSYVLDVHDEISNTGAAAWSGSVYRQLMRVPPVRRSGAFAFNDPETFSFAGAAWYSPEDKYEKRKFGDFSDGPLNKTVTGGWIAMSQHHFISAWIPDPAVPTQFQLGQVGSVPYYVAREVGPALALAPGETATSSARLWIGPKLQGPMEAVAPGLRLSIDYGVFTFIAQPIYWLLSWFHSLVGNWGWAIVLLVLTIKLILYKLSETQYKSFAKMRRLQPKMEALKERYGEDKQKFQMAVMELYKKEKVNPAAGCLPILVQMPVFLALYWVLLEAPELRHAVWIPGWIDNLTARDPWFILPLLNAATMYATQRLSPMATDPLQRKMMNAMPIIFGVMFAFFPAGLVLYWFTNGLLGLLQQWWLLRRHGDKPATAKG